MQAMFNCNIKLECKEPSGKQNRLQHYTHSHHLQEQDRPLGIFKSCIHSLRIHIVCFDHTHPLLPTSLTSTLFPSTQLLSSFFTQVQFVLPTYSWACGLPLECIYFLGATLWKKTYSPSPSGYWLPIAPELGMGFMFLCAPCAGIWPVMSLLRSYECYRTYLLKRS